MVKWVPCSTLSSANLLLMAKPHLRLVPLMVLGAWFTVSYCSVTLCVTLICLSNYLLYFATVLLQQPTVPGAIQPEH